MGENATAMGCARLIYDDSVSIVIVFIPPITVTVTIVFTVYRPSINKWLYFQTKRKLWKFLAWLGRIKSPNVINDIKRMFDVCVTLCLSIARQWMRWKKNMKTERVKRSELTYYLALEFMLSTYSQTCSMLILMLLHRLHLVYNVSKVHVPYRRHTLVW